MIADTVQFLGSREGGGSAGGGDGEHQFVPAGAKQDDFAPTGADDDIPF